MIAIIFGNICWIRIRRTQSGGLPADGVDDFKRGGVRSTAGPRLAGVGNRDSARYDWHVKSQDIQWIRIKTQLVIQNQKIACCFSERWTTLLSQSGHVIRCVPGWRIMGWDSTFPWPVSGWAVDRLFSRLPRMTLKRYTPTWITTWMHSQTERPFQTYTKAKRMFYRNDISAELSGIGQNCLEEWQNWSKVSGGVGGIGQDWM